MFTILTSLFEGLFSLITELFSLIFGSFEKKKGYTADFASESVLLSRFHDGGFCLTGRRKNLSRKNSHMNALIHGQTGSGKTMVTLLPSLYTMSGSFIVHDPAKELHRYSAGYLASKKYNVKVLNFTEPETSAGFNPMARANTSAEIQKLASMLVRTSLSGGKEDPFWTSQATTLLAVLITIVKSSQPKEQQHLHNVRRLLNEMANTSGDDATPNPVDSLFVRFANPATYAEYKSVISYDSKLLTSIIATAKSALTIFADESVARVTSVDTIDFAKFRTQPTVLYIQNSIADQKYYSVLSAIFFEQLASYILSRFPEKSEQDLYILCDEFSSIRVPVFPLFFSNCRKHRAGIMAIVQDFNSVIGAYSKQEAEVIRANCYSRVFFSGGSLEQTQELEKILGRFTYTDEKGNKQSRELMTADEIRRMPKNRALILCGNFSPIYARMRPAHKSWKFREYMNMPAPAMKSEVPASVPVIRLTTSR